MQVRSEERGREVRESGRRYPAARASGMSMGCSSVTAEDTGLALDVGMPATEGPAGSLGPGQLLDERKGRRIRPS